MPSFVFARRLIPFVLIPFVLLAWPEVPAAAQGLPLTLERTIPLDGVSGRIDHIAIDRAGSRLFVAEHDNGSLDVIDLKSNWVTGRIKDLKEPQGVEYLPSDDVIVVAEGGDGSVQFYRAVDLSLLGTIELGDDADDVRLDSITGNVIVGFGNGALAVIDGHSRRLLEQFNLLGHPEGFQLDARGARIYVNVPNAGQVSVLDLATRKTTSWSTAGRGANFPMAIDNGTVAIASRDPSRLILFDTTSGAVAASIDACGDADDLYFDPPRGRIYISCGDGNIDVIQRTSQSLSTAARVPSARGARTSLFVPELDRLFVAAPASAGVPAAILVYRPS